ncbi:MAG: M48 family metalloprotease [Litoreibacter sp.]|nr:M48 family metalloprotease [Litoreibacter sp.]
MSFDKVKVLLACFGLMLCAVPAHAASLIRDAELELSLRKLMQPVLQTAGMGSSRVRVLVINDPSLNAFVTDSRHIFVHSGLIMKLDRPEALQAVLAHELAHITNGHLSRRGVNAQNMSRAGAIGMALSVASALAGQGQAGIALGVGTASSALRVFLSHTRAEESSADQTALRYLADAGIDPEAMSDTLDLFVGQEALRPGRQDPYARSHPLSRDRLRAVDGFAAALKSKARPAPAEIVYWYNRMDAKLQGFLRNPKYVLRRPEAQGSSETARLRRAIAYHQMPNPKKALSEIDGLLRMRPKDAYYHELKGQILLESGNPSAAANSYRKAVSLAPKEPLIQRGLGRALLALGTRSSNAEALSVLRKARARDPGDPGLLRNLALAHAKNGQNAMASLATAERYAILGRFGDAKTHAKRAQGSLPRGSAGWLRAGDVLRTAETALARQKKR